MLHELRDLDPDLYAALDAQAVELTGKSMTELPNDELRWCLEVMRQDLISVSPAVPVG
jgi:hypothetical protein